MYLSHTAEVRPREEPIMTTTVSPATSTPPRSINALAGIVGGIVVLDAISVGAPGLALLAVPFAIIAWRFRKATWWGSTLALLFCALFVAIGVNFIIANGFDAPWGDLLFAYVGTPVTLAAGVLIVRHLIARRRRQ